MDLEALEYVPDAIVVVGRDGAIRHVNKAAEDLFRYRRADLVGRPIEALVPARFRTQHRAERAGYAAAPHVRPMGVGLELRALRSDGTELSVEISLAPMMLGDEPCTITVTRDVTERKLLEQRARELVQAKEEIRQRDEVLAIASHELRAPV